MDSPTTLGIGSEVLGYRIEALAGQGGMGVVYRAHDQRLKRTVALKLIAPDLALDERFRERFAREADLAMALEHPNVVPVHDAGKFDGQLYLVMRYVDGTDLRSLLREEGALEPRRALAIVAQIASALDAAHSKGLVHRDVKPSNVLLDRSEHVYLADFGLTRRFADDGGQFTGARSLGTPAYLAPEQIEGGPVDGRADVYSLGCLFYECLVGEPPFVGPSRLAVAWAHLEEQPPAASARNHHLPIEVDTVLAKAMAKDPDARYGTCAALVEAVGAALGLRTDRTRRPSRLLVAVALVIAAAAFAAAIVTRGGAAESGPPEVGPNKLVRIDPRTNKVSTVVEVGENPEAVAVHGNSVWVYSVGEGTIVQIDARTNDVQHTTAVGTIPVVTAGAMSMLAADAGGAWLVGYRPDDDRWLLTRVRRDGGGKREIELNDAREVVAAGGSVWVLGHRGLDRVLIRVDPSTGAVTRRVRLAASAVTRAHSLAVGGGYAWARNEETGRLYRVDPRTGAVRSRDLGDFILRPVFGHGHVFACVAFNGFTKMVRIHPRTLQDTAAGAGLPAEEGTYAVGFGSVWRHDVPSGTLMRFDPRHGTLHALVQLLQTAGAASVTSITTGANAVWVAVS